jgi:hypothetical protein
VGDEGHFILLWPSPHHPKLSFSTPLGRGKTWASWRRHGSSPASSPLTAHQLTTTQHVYPCLHTHRHLHWLHSPRLLPSRFRKALTKCLCEFYERQLRGSLGSEEPNSPIHLRPKLIKINPFLPTTDGALFSWETERDLLEGTHRGAGVVYPVSRVKEKVRSGALVMDGGMLLRLWTGR